jgi:hypothetical protein
MDEQQAMTIVSSLANGVHPVTGEIFADDSPYQSPVIVRALFVARLALETHLKGEACGPSADGAREVQGSRPQRSGGGANAGKPWNEEEDRQLLARFDASQSLAEIARAHGRTQNGVRARLEKHGRLEPSTATRWNRPQGGGASRGSARHNGNVSG